ncbi:MAG: hypothetical protein L0Y54_10320 [Sporichthyaceae bacterium]|nr:hypothetical protein [Sporichthyaceae bacterium]
MDARYLLRVLIEPRVDAQRIADALRELAGVEPETDTGPAAARLYSLLAQAEHCLHRLDDTAGALAKPLRR